MGMGGSEYGWEWVLMKWSELVCLSERDGTVVGCDLR